jgi:hypothetical protein
LDDLDFTKEKCLDKCIEDDAFCKIISRIISKDATRQGSKDETEQLKSCNTISQKCGIFITNLSATELRATKDGRILSNNEMKNNCVPKDNCLKSFDGRISGRIKGFIAAKVAYGLGGHQDNVFEEIDNIAHWWKTYKSNEAEILVLLIDTDLVGRFERMKEKYKDVKNVMVYNHVDFQQYIIDTYYIADAVADASGVEST